LETQIGHSVAALIIRLKDLEKSLSVKFYGVDLRRNFLRGREELGNARFSDRYNALFRVVEETNVLLCGTMKDVDDLSLSGLKVRKLVLHCCELVFELLDTFHLHQ